MQAQVLVFIDQVFYRAFQVISWRIYSCPNITS